MEPPPVTNGLVIAGYFPNWAIYARNFNVCDLAVSAQKLTHVLYAFANFQEDGTVILGDVWADKDKHFPPEQTINGKADSWNEGDANLYGNFKQFYLLKQKYRHLKVSLSIGGWTWSTNFSVVAADPAKRAVFVKTAIRHLANLGLDGIDIDWEFPKDDKDAFHYVHLLYELRIALDMYQQSLGQTNQPRLILSVAVPCGPSKYKLLRLQQMAPYVDIFYLMAYDFAGSWDTNAGHQSAMYGGALNVHQAIEGYISGGVPPHKIVMGMPAYGRGFLNTNGPNTRYDGLPEGSWEKGMYDYKHLPPPGHTEHHDMEILASWCYCPEKRELITYDSPYITQAKCDYIKQRQLGGAMVWELSADHPGDHPRCLLNVLYDSFAGNTDTMPNHLDYPSSGFNNLKGHMK
ncbi:chitinase [Phycomyces blakesleeanus]|uniref:Chitinase n=1 Tax=Phycomyces blakesleeanus TaxID=4837 RepID=A0ABR3AH19_PHYBL